MQNQYIQEPTIAMIFPFRKKFPVILPHREHLMSRGHVDKAVLDILYRLRKNGYDAYLVGGCVRDILLDKTPKDFDIVTDARPRQIKRLFSRCFLIGRRFRLAHVYISKDRFVEVATFRALVDREEVKEGPRFAENNVFGTIEEDAQRRDFTVNALYFNGADSSIVDYTGGLDDLKKKVLRSVGKAAARFKEDPVRIIRAARFCAQLGFAPSCRDFKAAVASAPLIKEANASRMLEELYKILRCGASAGTFMNLEKYRILCYWLPELADRKYHEKLLARLAAVDRRRARGEDIPACVLLTSLFYDICEEAAAGMKNIHEAFIAVKERYQEMAVRLRFPKAEWDRVCNTVVRQDVFRRTSGGARWGRFVKNFTSNDYFPDALRFFEILSEAEGKYREELNYWKRQAPARSVQEQSQPEAPPENAERKKKRRRRRRPRKRNGPPPQERQAT